MNECTTVDNAREMASTLFSDGSLDPIAVAHTKRVGNQYESPGPELLNGKIVEIDGTYERYIESEQRVMLKTQGGSEAITLVQSTVFSASITEKGSGSIQVGDQVNVIGIKADDCSLCVAVTIIRFEEKAIFEQVKSLFGRANAIRDYYGFFKDNPQKRQVIAEQSQNPRNRRYDADNDNRFFSVPEQMLKYALTKETYPYEIQRVYEDLFVDQASHRHKAQERLMYLSGIKPTCSERKTPSKKRLLQILDEKIYKNKPAKQRIHDVVYAKKKARKKGYRFLFVGGHGTGKTLWVTTISEIFGLPYETVALDQVTYPMELEGSSFGYENAILGRFLEILRASGTEEMVLGFENIDKINRNTVDGDPSKAVVGALTGEFEAKFLGCRVSTKNTIIIATATNERNIPESIKRCFDDIIYMEEYSVEDRIVIGERYIIPEILSKYGMSNEDIHFSEEALRYIITNYCGDEGGGDLKKNLERIVCRAISSEKPEEYRNVTISKIAEILTPLVQDQKSVYFMRHIDEYSDIVKKEIRRCLSEMEEDERGNVKTLEEDKNEQLLKYLLACRDEKGEFLDGFDPVRFSNELHKELFGMDRVIREVTLFFHTASLQGKNLNSNLALYGGFGVGKTAVSEAIAKAGGYYFCKISLNGIDDVRDIKGFPRAYKDSHPGLIMKGVKDAGSKKLVIMLDELDKLRPEYAKALIDLLDRSFLDNFLGIQVDFSKVIIIATANNWGDVPAVLRDRFITVKVEGYSRREKEEIVTRYIIPKIERSYPFQCVSVSIDDNALKYLLEVYCPSFGVRDARDAMQKIVSSKLLDQAGRENSTIVNISKADVRRYLGNEPIPRGNFLADGNRFGVAKALGVSNGIMGNAFAIETVLCDENETLEMTGLPQESAIDSVKVAVTCIRKMFPDLLRGKHIHVHFGEGSVPKDGPSAGVALFMSILSAAIERPLEVKRPYDIAFTGEISLTGGVFAVGGLYEKIQAACDTGCCIVFIPAQNYEQMDKEKLAQFSCEIVPVTHITQVLNRVFPGMNAVMPS